MQSVVSSHSLLKECQLLLLPFYAFASLVEILLVRLEAEEVAVLFDASDSRCAAAYGGIQHRVTLVGVG